MPEYQVFFCAPKAQKKTKANVFSDLDQTSSAGKRFIMLPQQNLFLWDNLRHVIPSVQDKSMLPARVANQKTVFASPCPLVEPPL